MKRKKNVWKREKRHLRNCDVNPHEDSQFLVKQFIHTLHYKTDMNYTFSDHDMTSIWWQKIEIINTFYHSEKKSSSVVLYFKQVTYE